MNLHDDEVIAAYVDGELDDATRTQFESAMAADAGLARRVAVQQALRRRLRDAFGGALDEPVPERLLAAARSAPADPASRVVPLRPRAAATSGRWRAHAPWLAAAASLVLGIAIGQRMVTGAGGGDGASLIVADASGPLARGALAEALTDQLAAYGTGSAEGVLVGLSYRAGSGEYCRTFEIDGREVAQAGLACRAGGGEWRVDVLETLEPESRAAGGLRQAGARLPESVRAAVERSITGEVLDAEEERAAREAGWRASAIP